MGESSSEVEFWKDFLAGWVGGKFEIEMFQLVNISFLNKQKIVMDLKAKKKKRNFVVWMIINIYFQSLFSPRARLLFCVSENLGGVLI